METDIVGYKGMYKITEKGHVYSYKYKKKRRLKPQKASQSKKGYYQVRLFAGKGDRKGTLFYVHRLMWQTFIGEIPKDKEMDHINGDTKNNSLENLQILSRRRNVEKFNDVKHGPSLRARRDEFIELYKKLGTYELVAQEVGVTFQRVYRVIKDIIHTKDKTGKYSTRRFNPDLHDDYTDIDFRKGKI